MKSFKKFISPAILISILVWTGLAAILVRSVICGPYMEPVDTCRISEMGNYLFPHPLIYTLADMGLDGWGSVILLLAIDVILTITLFAVIYTRGFSVVRSIVALIIYFLISGVMSYLSVYYYLSP